MTICRQQSRRRGGAETTLCSESGGRIFFFQEANDPQESEINLFLPVQRRRRGAVGPVVFANAQTPAFDPAARAKAIEHLNPHPPIRLFSRPRRPALAPRIDVPRPRREGHSTVSQSTLFPSSNPSLRTSEMSLTRHPQGNDREPRPPRRRFASFIRRLQKKQKKPASATWYLGDCRP